MYAAVDDGRQASTSTHTVVSHRAVGPGCHDILVRLRVGGAYPVSTRLSDVMTAQPQTISPDEPFLHALRIMYESKFRHLPVVEFGRPLGMVSVRDALDDDLYALRVDLAQRQETE